jgi:hypothetical protein
LRVNGRYHWGLDGLAASNELKEGKTKQYLYKTVRSLIGERFDIIVKEISTYYQCRIR